MNEMHSVEAAGEAEPAEPANVIKLRSVAVFLVWASALWTGLMVLGVIGNLALVLLTASEGDELASMLRNGSYNVVFGAISALIFAGAYQMSRTRSRGLSVLVSALACIPCVSPWFVVGIPFGIRALLLLRDPDVKAAFAAPRPHDSAAGGDGLLRKVAATALGIFVWVVVFNLTRVLLLFAERMLSDAFAQEMQPYFRPAFEVSLATGVAAGWFVGRLLWPKKSN